MKKNNARQLNKKGFTLIEMIVTVVVIALLAAIAIPSVYSYMEKGKQTERDNIARTLFLTAQNQMVQMRTTKNLQSFVSTGAINIPDKVIWTDESGVTDEKDVKYISKEKSDLLDESNLVVQLFKGDVVNDDILKNSICVEFDSKTGSILSVFYSDMVKNGTKLHYSADGSFNDVSGERPYTYKKERKQGYYGGEDISPGKERETLGIEIYQGEKDQLEDIDGKYSDVLYAEILVPESMPETKYELHLLDNEGNKITGEDGNSITKAVTFTANPSNTSDTEISLKIAKPNISGDIVYRAKDKTEDTGIANSTNRYIWVIDLLEKDSYSYNSFSIGVASSFSKLKPQMIRAAISEEDSANIQAKSSKSVHSHYNNEMYSNSTTTYGINAPRHLYNIRYNLEGSYSQGNHIDLKQVENLLPLTYIYEKKDDKYSIAKKAFTGTYISPENRELQNLTITSTNSAISEVGLFGTIGQEAKAAKVRGISLVGGNIKTTNDGNIGSLAGHLVNGEVIQCNSYSNVLASDGSTPINNLNAGGLIGNVRQNGKIDQCYNGGFYKAVDNDEPKNGDFGSISLSGTSYKWAAIGGLAGINEGTIESSYNNARVQVNSVNVAEDGLSMLKDSGGSYTIFDTAEGKAYIGGIAGTNYGSILNVYNTNFVGKTKLGGSGDVTANCETGGISGYQEANKGTQSNAYYLPNGEVSEKDISIETSKSALSATINGVALGSKFEQGTGYKGAYADTTKANYPYPTLTANKHKTNWEDIGFTKKEEVFESNIKYYEIYDGVNTKTGRNYGLWSPGDGNDLLAYDKKVLQEGYALFSEDLGIAGNSTKIFVSDSPNGGNFIEKNVGFETSIYQMQEISCIVLNTVTLEEVSLGLNPIYVKLTHGNGNKDDKTYFKGYINPLFAKAIYKDKPNIEKIEYYVRSPRHLDNIDFTRANLISTYSSPLSGKFLQEVDVDFTNINSEKGYKKIINASLPYSEKNIEKMSFERTVVEGTFTGVFNGYKGKINSIIGFANTPSDKWEENNVGIFDRNAGTIKGLALRNVKIEGGYQNSDGSHIKSGMGTMVGVNSGTIGGIYANEKVSVTGGMLESNGSNVGGLIGINSESGKVFNASTYNSTISAIKGKNDNYGGLIGYNGGVVGSVDSNIEVSNTIVRGDEENVGGLVGANSASGKIVKAIVNGTTITSRVDWSRNFGGIVGNNNGQIGTTDGGVAIYNSVIEGRSVQHAGGIVGLNKGDKASIDNAMVIDTKIKGDDYIGGIAGTSERPISNVFISHTKSEVTLRSPQTEDYESPITAVEHYAGGIVGDMNGGKLSNAYMAAAVGDNVRTIAGNNIKIEQTENIYYLVGHNFNDKLENPSKQGNPLLSTELEALQGKEPFTNSNGWTEANGDYPYPVLENLQEPTTWCAEIRLAYYEKYENDEKRYCWLGEKHDELKDNVVVEEGYAVIGLPENYGNFTAQIGNKSLNGKPADGKLLLGSKFLDSIPKTTLDAPLELKLTNDERDELKLKQRYIIPTFAKQIYSGRSTVSTLEIRSPRHFKNVYDFASNDNYKGVDKKKFIQTNDIAFDVYKINGNTLKIENADRAKSFYGTYDGKKKQGVSAIKNVIGNGKYVAGTETGAIGGLFSNNGPDSTIKNLILDGFEIMGEGDTGGLVQSNYGTIENVSLRNSSIKSTGFIGGLAEVNYNTIKQCSIIYSIIEPAENATGGIVGGIAARNHNMVENVYVYKGLVSGKYAGGLLGMMNEADGQDGSLSPTLKNAYYAAKLPNSEKLIYESGDIDFSGRTGNIYLLVGDGVNEGVKMQDGINGEVITAGALTALDLTKLGNSEDLSKDVWQKNLENILGHSYPILKFENFD